MAGLWDYESVVSRRARRKHARGWTRRAIFESVPADIAESLVPPEGTPWPGESGKEAAVLMDSDVEFDHTPRRGLENLARIILYYWPRTWEQWLEAHPNKGVLIGRSNLISEPCKTWNGKILEGRDPSDLTGRTKWKITSGSNTLFRGQGVYEVYAVINNRDTYFYPYVSKVGGYNSNLMMKFPLWPEASREGQWLLTYISCEPRATASKLYTTRYQFALNMDTVLGWADPCISTKFTVCAVQVPVIDEYGEPTGDMRVKSELVATTTTQSTVMLSAENFSVIDNMLNNSW